MIYSSLTGSNSFLSSYKFIMIVVLFQTLTVVLLQSTMFLLRLWVYRVLGYFQTLLQNAEFKSCRLFFPLGGSENQKFRNQEMESDWLVSVSTLFRSLHQKQKLAESTALTEYLQFPFER